MFTYSSTVPRASYVVSPLLINKLPGNGSAFTELDVNLNVLSPVLNLKGGGGVVNGSLKKNDPWRSPKVSAIYLTFDTVACAPLLWPNKVTPLVGIYPKNLPCASSANERTSIFKTVDDAE